MLKTAQEILVMLREQEAVLDAESDRRARRDEAIIDAIKEDGAVFRQQIEVMTQNVRLAIRKIEGPTEEPRAQD